MCPPSKLIVSLFIIAAYVYLCVYKICILMCVHRYTYECTSSWVYFLLFIYVWCQSWPLCIWQSVRGLIPKTSSFSSWLKKKKKRVVSTPSNCILKQWFIHRFHLFIILCIRVHPCVDMCTWVQLPVEAGWGQQILWEPSSGPVGEHGWVTSPTLTGAF